MTSGFRVIFVYFLISYFVPMLGNAIFKQHIVSIYKIYPLTWYAVFTCVAVYLLYFLFDKVKMPSVNLSFLYPYVKKVGKGYVKIRLPFSLVALVIAIISVFAGLTSYRYQSVGISEHHSLLLLVGIMLQLILSADLFYLIFCKEKEVVTKKNYFENIIISLAFLFFSGGVGDLFLSLNALFYCLSPRLFNFIIFTQKRSKIIRTMKIIICGVLVEFIIFAVAFNAGNLIKGTSEHRGLVAAYMGLYHNKENSLFPTGQTIKLPVVVAALSPSSASAIVSSPPLRSVAHSAPPPSVSVPSKTINVSSSVYIGKAEYFMYYMVERMSIYYYSFLYTLSRPSEMSTYEGLSSVRIPLETAAFRASYLLGGILHVKKPEIGTIALLNYRLLLANHSLYNGRAGSAPGLLGGFNYTFFFPFNILFCAFYLCFISKLITVLMRQGKGEFLSWIGAVIFLFYAQILFNSPLDFLLIFDPGFLMMVIFICFYTIKIHTQGLKK